MKSDLDALMQANQVDILLVTGPGLHNPAIAYFTGPAFLTSADVILRRGEAPVLFYHPMEREAALKTGLHAIPYSQYPYAELYQEAGGDEARLLSLRYQRMLADLGISAGRVMVYGLSDAGRSYAVLSDLQRGMPGLEFRADLQELVLRAAMATKDEQEVARIRAVGQVTTRVVGQVADFLSGQRAVEDVLIHPDGRPVTIADVKGRINLWLAEAGLETPEDTIFAIGHDAGVPHAVGKPEDILRLGQTIVFDIFPCEKGGGYFYDFTRTWCLGFAPDEALALYEQVKAVYDQIFAELAVGQPCTNYQRRACELFESMGHPSQLNSPSSEVGYPHGLGHGLGLYIHSRPWFRLYDPNNETLQPGTVMTLEPGLYYPERGLGIRLEDTIWFEPGGKKTILADFPHDLVLPVRGR